jgi:hypothetical protein
MLDVRAIPDRHGLRPGIITLEKSYTVMSSSADTSSKVAVSPKPS